MKQKGTEKCLLLPLRAKKSKQKKKPRTEKKDRAITLQRSIEKVHVNSTNNIFAAATVVRGRGLVVGCYGLKQNL